MRYENINEIRKTDFEVFIPFWGSRLCLCDELSCGRVHCFAGICGGSGSVSVAGSSRKRTAKKGAARRRWRMWTAWTSWNADSSSTPTRWSMWSSPRTTCTGGPPCSGLIRWEPVPGISPLLSLPSQGQAYPQRRLTASLLLWKPPFGFANRWVSRCIVSPGLLWQCRRLWLSNFVVLQFWKPEVRISVSRVGVSLLRAVRGNLFHTSPSLWWGAFNLWHSFACRPLPVFT